MIKLYNDDCMNILKNIESESVDCVITDCPYLIGGMHNVNGKILTNYQFNNKHNVKTKPYPYKLCKGILDSEKKGTKQLFKYNSIKFSEWIPEVYRILKKKTHCYIMINSQNLKTLWEEAVKVGFVVQNILIWKKNNQTPNHYYMQQAEFILFLSKRPAKNINNMSMSNIFDINNIQGNKIHPTEKPVELMSIMVEQSTKKNDLVVDPFMGGGSTGIACKNLERSFVGIEIDKEYYDIAKERIEKNFDNREKENNIFNYI